MFFGTATDKLNIDFLKTRAGVNADFQRWDILQATPQQTA